MKFIHADMATDMTKVLTHEAIQATKDGYKVYFVAPNSLSFQKEARLLHYLQAESQAVATFDILVTRFSQIGHYFGGGKESGAVLDDVALSMLVYRVLSQMDPEEIGPYKNAAKDHSFIQQILSLYHELDKGQFLPSDLRRLADEGVALSDLSRKKLLFLSGVLSHLQDQCFQLGLASDQRFAKFVSGVSSGQYDHQLSHAVFIFDGFTRFTAQERELIALLDQKAASVILSAYLSKEANQMQEITGSVFETSRRFMDSWPQKERQEVADETPTLFDKAGKIFEQAHSFQVEPLALSLSEEEQEAFQIWRPINQKVEIEAVAQDIRQKIDQKGYRYQDISIFVGEMEEYQQSITHIFEQYGIPVYLSQQESMAHHPLTTVIESLYRILAYDWRGEDLLNLVKTGLFGQFSKDDENYLTQYVRYADLNGKKSWMQPIPNAQAGKIAEIRGKEELSEQEKQLLKKESRYQLVRVNRIRQQLVNDLRPLEGAEGSAKNLLRILLKVLQEADLEDSFQALIQSDEISRQDQLKHEEIGKLLNHLLEMAFLMLPEEEMSMEDLLSILSAGIRSATYRMIPATVDVVQVRKYDLVEPHSNRLVYALGLVEGVFPMTVTNRSLLTDDERMGLNHLFEEEGKYLDVQALESQENNLYTAMSLFFSAEDQLVLSSPELISNSSRNLSPYLAIWTQEILEEQTGEKRAIRPLLHVGESRPLQTLGYALNDILEHLILSEQDTSQLTEADRRLLTHRVQKELDKEHIYIPRMNQSVGLETHPLTPEVLKAIFPPGEGDDLGELRLSASSVRDYYSNPYLYFVNHIIRLQEEESLKPGAAINGSFMHRVLEMSARHPEITVEQLAQEIAHGQISSVDLLPEDASDDQVFAGVFDGNVESQLTYPQLLAAIKANAAAIADLASGGVAAIIQPQTALLEKRFLLELGLVGRGDLTRRLLVNGAIDRVDQLTLSNGESFYGVVDYKSSAQQFKIDEFLFGLKYNQQLVTYMDALQHAKERTSRKPILEGVEAKELYGAMFSSLSEPRVALKQIQNHRDLLKKALDQLAYKGIFTAEHKDILPSTHFPSKQGMSRVAFDTEKMNLLIAYNRYLYRAAAQQILQGKFPILPYTKNEKTIEEPYNQIRALTQFEPDRHLSLVLSSHRNLYPQWPKDANSAFEIIQQILESESKGES